jgi:hypothetical protein
VSAAACFVLISWPAIGRSMGVNYLAAVVLASIVSALLFVTGHHVDLINYVLKFLWLKITYVRTHGSIGICMSTSLLALACLSYDVSTPQMPTRVVLMSWPVIDRSSCVIGNSIDCSAFASGT